MLHLEVEYDYEFSLIALSCFEKGYRLAWLLNKELDSCLGRVDDLELRYRKKHSVHEVFTGDICEGDADLTLIKNRSEGGILLPELVQIDYLLLAKNMQEELQDVLKVLRKVPQIRGVYEIEVNKLKNKEHLIIE